MIAAPAALHADVRIGEANVSQQGFILLAHPWLFVMTSHVVPVHAVVVELIEDGQTVLGRAALNGLAIIGLRFADAETIETYVYTILVRRNVHFMRMRSKKSSVLIVAAIGATYVQCNH